MSPCTQLPVAYAYSPWESAVIVILALSSMFFVIMMLPARIGIYPLYSKMTNRPWSKWETFQFKWFIWFPWDKLENEYNKAHYKCCTEPDGSPSPPPNVWIRRG